MHKEIDHFLLDKDLAMLQILIMWTILSLTRSPQRFMYHILLKLAPLPQEHPLPPSREISDDFLSF